MSGNLSQLNLELVEASQVRDGAAEFALVRDAKGHRLAVAATGDAGRAALAGVRGRVRARGCWSVRSRPGTRRRCARRFEWLRPRPLGTKTSAGLGDRLGLATPGHVARRPRGGRHDRADLPAAVDPGDGAHAAHADRGDGRRDLGHVRRGLARRHRRRRRPPQDHGRHRRDAAGGLLDVHDRPERARRLRRRHGRPRHAARQGRGAAVGRARGQRGVAAPALRREDVRGRAPRGRASTRPSCCARRRSTARPSRTSRRCRGTC